MRVLVTGAGGFLGSHVVQRLLARGLEVRALVRTGRPRAHLERLAIELVEGDLLDEPSLNRACRGAQGLVHCAARMGHWAPQHEIQRRTNVEGSSTLWRAAHRAKLERIVHVSSISAVGANRDGAVLDESARWIGTALRSNYVFTKRESEERAFAAARGGMPIAVVNPGMLAGPRLDGRGPSATVRQVAAGTGWVQRGGVTVCDVEDVAEGIAVALERARPNERYILGGHNLSHLELRRALAARLGVAGPRWVVPEGLAWALARGAGAMEALRLTRPPWTAEIFRSFGWCAYADSSKAVRELGYRIRPLEEIVERMVAPPAGGTPAS